MVYGNSATIYGIHKFTHVHILIIADDLCIAASSWVFVGAHHNISIMGQTLETGLDLDYKKSFQSG
jgi:hypothetical protein